MKKIVKDPDKEKRILQASVTLFSEAGYQATSTDLIAQTAQVSKGLLFHYFANKAGLYLATYHYAVAFFYQLLEPTIWTEANDLIDMVVRATKYKLSLQLKYPQEFRFLTQVYGELEHLPTQLKATLANDLDQQFKRNLTLVTPVIDRLPLKAGVTKSEVNELLLDVLNAESARIQKELMTHPEWQTIEEMNPLIEKMIRKLQLLEHGFMA